MNETTEELADLANDIFEEGISVSIARKDALMLFGAVIAANVATVFVLSAITGFTKKFVKKPEDEIDDEMKKIDEEIHLFNESH